MQLFFIACNYCGESYDWFVSAPNADRALELWLENEFVDGVDAAEAHVKVFRVPPVSPTELVHEWHTSWERRGVQKIKELK